MSRFFVVFGFTAKNLLFGHKLLTDRDSAAEVELAALIGLIQSKSKGRLEHRALEDGTPAVLILKTAVAPKIWE